MSILEITNMIQSVRPGVGGTGHDQEDELSQVTEGLECQIQGLVFISWLSVLFFPPRMSSKLQLLCRVSFERTSFGSSFLLWDMLCQWHWAEWWESSQACSSLDKDRK